jgi:octanoyl-[GcvH]:protein N-octanoyltransferase
VSGALRLVAAHVAGDAALDTALSAALLAGVVDGGAPVVRLAPLQPAVSFGRLDRLRPGFGAAVEAAAARGFAPVMRVGGGRAAAVHEGAILVGLAEPAGSIASTRERFAAMAGVLRAAFGRLGVDAAVGELAGEYCAGAWSVHAGGVKLAGVAQRITRGAAWTEAFVMVSGGARAREVLVPVYEALGLAFDLRTAGALDDLAAGLRWEDAAAALRSELAERHALLPLEVEPDVLALARRLRERHDAAPAVRA